MLHVCFNFGMVYSSEANGIRIRARLWNVTYICSYPGASELSNHENIIRLIGVNQSKTRQSINR